MASADNLLLTLSKKDGERTIYIDIASSSDRSTLFSVYEYQDARLNNLSENYDCYIEDLNEGGERKIECGESVIINEANHPNPVMEYRLRLYDKGKRKSIYRHYAITHTALAAPNQYQAMIDAIASYDENLLYDDEAKYGRSSRIAKASHRSTLLSISSLLNSKNHILNSLNAIYSNPVLIETKALIKSSSMKKQSRRSIIKNELRDNDGSYYSSRIIQKSDTPLNRYLMYILIVSQEELLSLLPKVAHSSTRNKKRTDEIKEKSSLDPTKRGKNAQYQIEHLISKQKLYSDFLEFGAAVDYALKRLLSSDMFIGVEPSSKRDASILSHPHYLNIERLLLMPLHGASVFDSTAFKYYSLFAPIKQTSALFEAYCLLSIDTSIRELGFAYIEEETDYNRIIKRFKKDEFEFDLYYAISAVDVSIAKEGDFYYVESGTRHISPDFFLVLKKNDVPICSLVMDAKCRKIESVYNDIKDGKYESTIRDYLSIRYSSNENPFVSPKIMDSLWLLFPKGEVDNNYDKINQLEYRFMTLDMDGEEDEFVGQFVDYMCLYL